MLGPIEDALAERERFSVEDAERWEAASPQWSAALQAGQHLLDFARIEAGRLEAAYEATDLAALTHDLASAFRSAIERAGLRLTVDALRWRRPPTSIGHVEKIVLNLLSNALKFTFEGRSRSHCAGRREPPPHGHRHGVGVAPEALPIFRSVLSRARDGVRTHEGRHRLALVQELARLHGGTWRRPAWSGGERPSPSRSRTAAPSFRAAHASGRAGLDRARDQAFRRRRPEMASR